MVIGTVVQLHLVLLHFYEEKLSWDIRLVVWRKFHFFSGTALSCLCVTQTTAFSCYGFHFIYTYMHAWCVSCNWERQRSMGVCDSVIIVLITLWKLKFLTYLLNVTQRFFMRIISYAMLCILQLAMSVPYRNCYAVGCTTRHREGRGKLFRFPRNPERHVHKIME